MVKNLSPPPTSVSAAALALAFLLFLPVRGVGQQPSTSACSAASTDLTAPTDMTNASLALQKILHHAMGTCVVGPGSCDGLSRIRLSESDEPTKKVIHLKRASFGGSGLETRGHSGCYRTRILGQPRWVSRATWNEASSGLVAHDAYSGILHAFTIRQGRALDGKRTSAVVAEFAYGSEINNPWQLDLARGPRSAVLASRPPTIDNRYGGASSRPYDWAVSGDRVFGYGPISTSRQGERRLAAPGETFELGFFVARINPRRSALEDLKLVLPFDKYPFYTLGHNYIAVNDDGAYFLAMDTEPTIHIVPYRENSLQGLALAMPPGYDRIPELQEMEQGEWNDTSEIYREVEGLKMPVGLYGHGEMIFLLTRAPSSDGVSTEWWVHRMDPRRNEVTGKVRLPTSAAHLTVVAGPEEWYVFEKGPVVDAGLQEISSLLVIPVDWLTDMDRSPLASPDIAGICASGEPAGSNDGLQLAAMALGAP